MMTETIVYSSNYELENEKDYLNHYIEFLHILVFEIFLKVYALLVFDVLDNNVCLSLVDLKKYIVSLKLVHDYIS